jgi:hypothetical protein
MSNDPASCRWTWTVTENPRVTSVFSSSHSKSHWYDDLENAPEDPIIGKVLCVVVGVAIARVVIAKVYPNDGRLNEAVALLDLAEAWVDNPTDDRFAQITEFLFKDHHEWHEGSDPFKVVWGALRIATSSVGNYEAGWALSCVVDDAIGVGLDAVKLAQQAVDARSKAG